MKRSTKCNEFLDRNEVINVSMIDGESEGNFAHRGCDCCDNGLGTTVFDVHGYSEKQNEVIECGSICSECLNYFYNNEGGEVLV